MIYTLTLNPAIDYYLYLDSFSAGFIHRSCSESICFGGKGINVSLMLKELGFGSIATGFISGFTGAALAEGLEEMGIKTDFVTVKGGKTRINVKIRTNVESDINAAGPDISDTDTEALFKKLSNLRENDYLVLAGNIQSSLPSNFYEKIMETIQGNGVKFIVDAEKEALTTTLKHSPFLIKPNHKELSDIFGVEIDNYNDALKYAGELHAMGARNVLVSMGKMGAVLIDEFGCEHIQKAHIGKSVNTVGAGDSVVAGFLAGYIEKNNYSYALKLGCACGSATAFSNGLATKEDIQKLL